MVEGHLSYYGITLPNSEHYTFSSLHPTCSGAALPNSPTACTKHPHCAPMSTTNPKRLDTIPSFHLNKFTVPHPSTMWNT